MGDHEVSWIPFSGLDLRVQFRLNETLNKWSQMHVDPADRRNTLKLAQQIQSAIDIYRDELLTRAPYPFIIVVAGSALVSEPASLGDYPSFTLRVALEVWEAVSDVAYRDGSVNEVKHSDIKTVLLAEAHRVWREAYDAEMKRRGESGSEHDLVDAARYVAQHVAKRGK